MSDNLKYQVLPKEITPKPLPFEDSLPLSDRERQEVKGLCPCTGFLIWAMIFTLTGIALTLIGLIDQSVLGGIIVASIVTATIAIANKRSKISALERDKAEIQRKRVQASKKFNGFQPGATNSNTQRFVSVATIRSEEIESVRNNAEEQ